MATALTPVVSAFSVRRRCGVMTSWCGASRIAAITPEVMNARTDFSYSGRREPQPCIAGFHHEAAAWYRAADARLARAPRVEPDGSRATLGLFDASPQLHRNR